MENKTILIVDDEKELASILSEKLQEEGFNTLVAYDGVDGLNKALKHKPDLIMLDVIMPQMNGFDVLKRLRKDDWGSNAKVIMLTVLDDEMSIAHAVKERGFEYLVKTDWKLNEIVEKVKALIL